MYQFEKQFRKENPQTVGETDSHFDLGNYKDWLEQKLIASDVALNDLVFQVKQYASGDIGTLDYLKYLRFSRIALPYKNSNHKQTKSNNRTKKTHDKPIIFIYIVIGRFKNGNNYITNNFYITEPCLYSMAIRIKELQNSGI